MMSKRSRKQEISIKQKSIVFAVIMVVITGIGLLIYLTDPLGWFDEGDRDGNENGCVPATVENGRFDVNGDGNVDLVDMVDLGDQYTISPYNNEYDATYDLNCDLIVDEADLQLLADIVYG